MDLDPTEAVAKPPRAGSGSNLSRREFLAYAWLLSLAMLALQSLIVVLRSCSPRQERRDGDRFVLGPAAILASAAGPPERYVRPRLWWVVTDQGALALQQACPHLGCALVWNDAAGTFDCPCHGSQFSRLGVCLSGPAPRGMDRLIIRVVDDRGRELVRTDDRGNPLPLPRQGTVVVEMGRRIPGPARAMGDSSASGDEAAARAG